MPKATLNTLSTLSVGGKAVTVNAVFCEDGVIDKNISKEVVFNEKYTTKKSIKASVKDLGIER